MEERIEVKLFSDVGIGETFMSRLIHFQDEILNGLPGLKDREAVRASIMSIVFEGLEPAFRSLRSLRSRWLDEKVPQREKNQLVESVYSYAVIAFKDRFQHAARLMGYNMGFVFQKDTEFEAGCSKFMQDHPTISPKFIESLKEDRLVWLTATQNVRNDLIDHAAGKDLGEKKMLAQNMTLEGAEVVFENSWRFVEDALIVFASDIVGPSFHGIKLLEIPEYQANKDHGKRVGWFLDAPTEKKSS